jgi:hypothetical protein
MFLCIISNLKLAFLGNNSLQSYEIYFMKLVSEVQLMGCTEKYFLFKFPKYYVISKKGPHNFRLYQPEILLHCSKNIKDH